MAYASLAGTLKSDMDLQNPKNVVLRILTDLREACIENLYRAQYLNGATSLNSHGLIGYRNEVAKEIGLLVIPDQHAGRAEVAKKYVSVYFERFYHLDLILSTTWKAIDQRKVHYGSVVAFLQYNRPVIFAGDAEEFLFHCFDVATGQFTREAVAWMLWKWGVLAPAPGANPLAIERALFPPLPPEAVDELKRSRDVLLSGERADNAPLSLSRSRSERAEPLFGIDEMRQSAEALHNHACDHEH